MPKDYVVEAQEILKVIDYVNTRHGANASVTGTFSCECGKNFPDGKFRYDTRGYTPDSEVLKLSLDRIRFPLHHLHASRAHSTDTNIPEYSIITELFQHSKSWEIFKVPEHAIERYAKIIKTEESILEASAAINCWIHITHATPNYSQQEVHLNSTKKLIMEKEKSIFEKPQKLLRDIQADIEYIVDEMTKNRTIPRIYLPRDEFVKNAGADAILSFKFNFIKDTYNTFKANNIFFPTEEATKAIESIDACLYKGRMIFESSSPL